jgi:hypothetical protein
MLNTESIGALEKYRGFGVEFLKEKNPAGFGGAVIKTDRPDGRKKTNGS